jgi:hypothetical protein
VTQDISSSSKDASLKAETLSPPSPERSRSSALASSETAPAVALKGKADLIKQTKPKKRAAEAKAEKPAKEKAKKDQAPAPAPEPFSLKIAIAAQMRAAQDALALPNAVAAVHETRIALKRLRVLARIADFAQPQGGAALEWGAQVAMKQLSAARDLAALENASIAVGSGGKADTLLFFARAASGFARQRRVAEAAALNDAAIALLRLAPIADAVPEIGPAQARRAAKALEKRAAHAAAAARGKRKVLLRHAWRKREKDRRNAALLMGRNWPMKARGGTARRLTEALGRERDALLLQERLAGSPRTPKAALRLIKRFRRERARRADRLGARLHRK